MGKWLHQRCSELSARTKCLAPNMQTKIQFFNAPRNYSSPTEPNSLSQVRVLGDDLVSRGPCITCSDPHIYTFDEG